jgi:hypothetical protein
LTPAVHKQVIDLIREGNYIEVACAAAGIGKVTYYGWLKRAKADRAAGRLTSYVQLLNDAEVAEAFAQTAMLREIRAEPGGNRWLAARRWRHLYGDQVTLTHEVRKELTAAEIRGLLFGSQEE